MIRTRQRQTGNGGGGGATNLRVISLLAITAVLSSLITTAAVVTMKSPTSVEPISSSAHPTVPPLEQTPATEEPNMYIDLQGLKNQGALGLNVNNAPDPFHDPEMADKQHLINWGMGHNKSALPQQLPWNYDISQAPTMNIAFITLDTTRYDSVVAANMSNLDEFLKKTNAGPFRKVYTHGTFSLPSHVSMLLYGRIPTDRRSSEPIYNDLSKCFFSVAGNTRKYDCIYKTPKAPNIPKSFEMIGYRTVGIGGVSWFNPRIVTSDFWGRDYFQEFHYHFRSARSIVLPTQIEILKKLKLKETQQQDGRPLFLFFNTREMHDPYVAGIKLCIEKGNTRDYCYEMTNRQEIQPLCLEYVDRFLPEIFAMLPKPVHVMLVGDHGDCFDDCKAEGHPRGHGFYHDKIIEVPMVHFILKDDTPYVPVTDVDDAETLGRMGDM